MLNGDSLRLFRGWKEIGDVCTQTKWRRILCYKKIQNIGALCLAWLAIDICRGLRDFIHWYSIVTLRSSSTSSSVKTNQVLFLTATLKNYFLANFQVPNEDRHAKRRKWRHLLILLVNAHASSAVLTFSCRRVKTIRKRYVRTQIFLKTERKNFVFKRKRIRVDGTLALIFLTWIIFFRQKVLTSRNELFSLLKTRVGLFAFYGKSNKSRPLWKSHNLYCLHEVRKCISLKFSNFITIKPSYNR